MTVSSTSNRVVYAGDGTTTVFPFAFKIPQAADLAVVYTDATGTDFPLLASQYAASGFGADGGGTVTYPLSGSPIAVGTTLTLYRSLAPVQSAALSNQGAMWPQVIESALDRIVMICQGAIDTAARALVVSPADSEALTALPSAAARANGVLGFDGAGQPYAARLTGGLVGVSNWLASNFLPMASAAAARGALGAIDASDDNAFTGTNTFPTQAAGDNSTKAATTAYADRALKLYVVRSYLAGLNTSNNGTTPNSKIDVAAGVCADDGSTTMLSFAGGTLDCATTGMNGLDAGALANSTWYRLFVIGKPDGTTALLASTSAAPTMPAGYTLKRQIWWFRTDGSAHIRAYHQNGDECSWGVGINDVVHVTYTSASARVARTLTVPPLTIALFNFVIGSNTSTSDNAALVTSYEMSDVAITSALAIFTTEGQTVSAGNGTPRGVSSLRIKASTSSQVYDRDQQGSYVVYYTTGWVYDRGRNA